MLGSGIAMWLICCTTSCTVVVSLSVGGVVQHVRAKLHYTDTSYGPPVAGVRVVEFGTRCALSSVRLRLLDPQSCCDLDL